MMNVSTKEFPVSWLVIGVPTITNTMDDGPHVKKE